MAVVKYYKGDIVKIINDNDSERMGKKYCVEMSANEELKLYGEGWVYYRHVVLYKRPLLNKIVQLIKLC